METLRIDPEFKALIPALTDDERAALEASLQAEGCRDALVTWDGVIVDGHNRYEICTQHGIAFQTVAREFEDRTAALLWIIGNQLARRNLTPYARGVLVLKQKEHEAVKAKARQGTRTDLPNIPPMLAGCGETRDKLAFAAGVSHGTLDKIEAVERDAPDVIKQKARDGEISTNRAYKVTQALKGADHAVADVVARHNVDDPETVDIIRRLQKSQGKPGSNGTFDEILRSGYVQPGDEEDAVHISDGVQAVTAALMKKADTHRVLSVLQSLSNEWYTPAKYVDAARRVMGDIDVDPASCDAAAATIKAGTYYTAETNGLKHEWNGRVWLNPPYGGIAADFVQKLLAEYDAKRVTQAVVLVNANSLETRWFAPLWAFTLCFTDHRINFVTVSGEDKSGSTHSSVFVYLGPAQQQFFNEFRQFGNVVQRVAWYGA